MMQPLISCQRRSKVPMCFSPPTGLRVQHSTTLGQASLPLPQTHPILLLCPPLPMTTTALENPLHSLFLLLLLLTHLLQSSPPVVQNINNLLISLPILYLHLSMTWMWMPLLLMVRLAPAQSDRRSMDQQASYQPVKNSRALTQPFEIQGGK